MVSDQSAYLGYEDSPPSAGGAIAASHIRDLVRETGLRREQLYMWERSYGFPQPLRDRHGDRIYPADQVEKLLLIQQLLKKGWRAGAIVPLTLPALRALWSADRPEAGRQLSSDVNMSVRLLAEHRVGELQSVLSRRLMTQGLRAFLLDTLLPLNEAVHDHCVRGELRAFQQFRYAEVAQRLLRDATRFTRPARESRSVLLATPPNDLNHLGLAMLEALLLIDGVHGIILGPGVPLHEIAAAAAAYKTFAVGLVFDHGHAVKVASQQVRSLRALLADDVSLWVTGRAAALISRPIERVVLAANLRQLIETLREKGALN